MRISLLLACVSTCFLFNSPAAVAQDWAKAMFKQTSFDFGVIARGAIAQHRFTFENIYLEDVHVASVRSSCGCTKATITNPSLKTYEESAIVATIDTRRFSRRREATITVVFDKPFPAEVQLHVYTYIRSDVVVQPGEAKFESVEQGSPASRTLNVSYAGRPDWKILQVQTNSPYIEASAIERSRTQGTVTYDLQVQLKPDAPPGYLRDQLVLITNDVVASATHVPVAVEAVIVPAAQVRPSPLSLGILHPGQTSSRNLVIQSKTPFRVLKATGPDARFTFKLPAESKTLQLLPVTFTADNAVGRVSGKIRIETDIAGTPVLEVSVDGQILAPQSEQPASPAATSSLAAPAAAPANTTPKQGDAEPRQESIPPASPQEHPADSP